MGLKIIRNGEPNFKKIDIPGVCPRCHKEVIISEHYSGQMMCQTDLNKTYHFSGYSCSLQKEDPEIPRSCLMNCPLVTKKDN